MSPSNFYEHVHWVSSHSDCHFEKTCMTVDFTKWHCRLDMHTFGQFLTSWQSVCRAGAILRRCGKTNHINLVVSRDDQAKWVLYPSPSPTSPPLSHPINRRHFLNDVLSLSLSLSLSLFLSLFLYRDLFSSVSQPFITLCPFAPPPPPSTFSPSFLSSSSPLWTVSILLQIQEEKRQFPQRFAWRLRQVGREPNLTKPSGETLWKLSLFFLYL